MIVVRTGAGLALVRPAPWQRLLAGARADALDRRLAAGACPEDDVLLAWRASLLTRPRTRRWLAGSIERLGRPQWGGGRSRPAAPLPAHVVHEVRADLDLLAAGLRRPRPVRAQGVAMTATLLRHLGDPATRRPGDLGAHLRRIAEALEDVVDPTWRAVP